MHGTAYKPQLIFYVDEKGINTCGSKPPNIVAAKGMAAQTSQTITVFGCMWKCWVSNIPQFCGVSKQTFLARFIRWCYYCL